MARGTYWTTGQGEMVDKICFDHYGEHVENRDRVLEHSENYKLSDQPTPLPEGTIVFLPEAPAIREIKVIKLWDPVKEA